MKYLLSLFACAIAFAASADVTQINYYWTGKAGDNKWSSVGNWATDSSGTTAATTYPGQNGYTSTTYDSANFAGTAAVNVVLDVDVTLWRCMFGTQIGGTYQPLTLSGPGHKLTMVNTNDSWTTRTYIYRETHVQNITIETTTWDTRVTTYFESGAKVNISNNLGMWESTSLVYVEDGADVTFKNSYSYRGQPTIVVNGGKLTGGTLYAYTGGTFTAVPHKLVVNGGTVKLAVTGNSKYPNLVSDIIVNGGTVTLDKMTLYGASVFRMTGGDVTIRHACSAETQFLITGGEKLTWLNGEPISDYDDLEVPAVTEVSSTMPYSQCMFVNTLTVPANTTYHWSSVVPVRKLVMGANSKLVIAAANGGLTADAFDLDDTATIEAEMPSSLTDAVHPILVCGPKAADLTSRVTVTGTVPSGWEVRRELKCVYLWKDELWDPDSLAKPYVWTGASPDSNNMQDTANWRTNAVPPGSQAQHLYYGGTNLALTNTVAKSVYTKGRHVVRAAAGPLVLAGEMFQFENYSWGVDKCTLNLHSPLPLTIEADVYGTSRSPVSSYGTSFIAFKSVFSNVKTDIGVNGHVKFAKTAELNKGLQMINGHASTYTIAEVMPGVQFTINAQLKMDTSSEPYPQLYKEKKCLLQVDEGASLIYLNDSEAKFGWLNVGTTNRIWGTLDVKCPMTGKGPEAYFGPGNFHLASTVATNGNFRIQLGGGIHFWADEFATADSTWPQYARQLEIVGDAVLEATNRWRYAVQDGTTATSDASVRQIAIAKGGALTIASTNGYPIAFGETIAGDGTLKFAPGAKVELLSDLGVTEKEWTDFATVGAVEGLPVPTDEKIRFRVTAKDGKQVVQCRKRLGFAVYLR